MARDRTAYRAHAPARPTARRLQCLPDREPNNSPPDVSRRHLAGIAAAAMCEQFREALAQAGETLRHAEGIGARMRFVDFDLTDNASRLRRHHQHASREEHRLVDAV